MPVRVEDKLWCSWMPDSVEMGVLYLLSRVNGFALVIAISLFQTKFTCTTFVQVRLALDQEYSSKFDMRVSILDK